MSDILPPGSPSETAPSSTSLETRIADIFDRNDGWLLVAGGICVAGAAYPVILVAIYAIVLVFVAFAELIASSSTPWMMHWMSLLPAAFIAAALAALCATIGAIWTGFLSVFVVPAFYLFARSLQLKTSIVWLGAICGGLVGFVAVLPFLMSLLLSMRTAATSPITEELFIGLIGPGLSTVVGQLGGAWGGQMSLRRQAKFARGNQPPTAHPDGPLLRFQIRHLLWITVWLALLLTLIRLSGIPFELLLPTLLAGLVYQSATLYVGWRAVRWFRRRQQERVYPT